MQGRCASSSSALAGPRKSYSASPTVLKAARAAARCRLAAAAVAAPPSLPARAPLRLAVPQPRSPCLAQSALFQRKRPGRLNWRRQLTMPAVAAAAAAAAPAPASGSGSSGPWERFVALANTLTNFFPVFVLGAALWALAQPTAFDWFDKTAITPALAVTMLGMGLTLTFDVRICCVAWIGACPRAWMLAACLEPSLCCIWPSAAYGRAGCLLRGWGWPLHPHTRSPAILTHTHVFVARAGLQERAGHPRAHLRWLRAAVHHHA